MAGGAGLWGGGRHTRRPLRPCGRAANITVVNLKRSGMRESLIVKELKAGSAAMRYDAAVIAEPDLQLFDPRYAPLQSQPVSEGGRQAAWYVDSGSQQAVLRRDRRGGLVAKISSDRYLWAGLHRVRSFNEFDILRSLYEAGLPVPRPLAAAYWRNGPTYRAAIMTE